LDTRAGRSATSNPTSDLLTYVRICARGGEGGAYEVEPPLPRPTHTHKHSHTHTVSHTHTQSHACGPHKGQGRSLKSTGPPRPASASSRDMMTAMAASSLLGLLEPGSSMMSMLRWELSPGHARAHTHTRTHTHTHTHNTMRKRDGRICFLGECVSKPTRLRYDGTVIVLFFLQLSLVNSLNHSRYLY